LLKAREFAAKGQTPFTPAESVFFGLREALRMLLAEGLERLFARHRLYRDMVRAGVRALGLELPVADAVASPVVTAVKTPDGLAPGAIRSMLLERFGVVTAVGQGQWAGSTFRIGHLGNIEPTELLSAMAALEMVLAAQGVAVSPGSGVSASAAVLGNYLA
jgi:aspartate aminotransferase-like enzyme